MLNPYWGNSFREFFITFGHRLALGVKGELSWKDLVSDEVQLFVLLFIALSSALVGTFLVLRKMTMVANSLSHTILLGIVITFVLLREKNPLLISLNVKTMILATFITALLTTGFTEWLNRGLRLQKDASIGLVFTSFFALGLMGLTLFSRRHHIGVEVIMGNVDALHFDDLKLAFFLFLSNSILFFLFFKPYEISTFDPILARNLGVSLFLVNHLLMLQTAASAVVSFRVVGAFLFLSLLTAPVLTARLFSKHLKSLLLISCGVGTLASFVTVALSRHFLSVYQVPFSTAGLLTVVLGGIFFIGLVYRTLKEVLSRRKGWVWPIIQRTRKGISNG